MSVKYLIILLLFPVLLRGEGNDLTRWKFNAGSWEIIQKGIKFNNNLFFTGSYRTSNFNTFTTPFHVRWAIEMGITGANTETDTWNGGFFIYPFFKFGPEINLTKSLFVGLDLGLGSSLLMGDMTAVFFPFGGIHSNYLYEFEDSTFLELEAGLQSPLLTSNAYVVYIGAGVAIRI